MGITETVQRKYNELREEWKKAPISTTLIAVPAAEMAVRTIGNFVDFMAQGKRSYIAEDLSANLSGAIFYTVSAFNPVPGSRRIAAAFFFGYSMLIELDKKNNYYSALAVRKVTRLLEDVLDTKLVRSIGRNIVHGVENILKAIPLPKHETWIGVAVLGLACIGYKGYRYIRGNGLNPLLRVRSAPGDLNSYRPSGQRSSR